MPALRGLFIARQFCKVALSKLIPLSWRFLVECAEITASRPDSFRQVLPFFTPLHPRAQRVRC